MRGPGAAAGNIPLVVLADIRAGRAADQRAGRLFEEPRRQVELDEGEAERARGFSTTSTIALRRRSRGVGVSP